MKNNFYLLLIIALMVNILLIFGITTKSVSAATLFSDNFAGTTIDTAKWNETDSDGLGGTIGKVKQNNALTITGDNTWGGKRLVSKDTFTRSQGITIQADFSVNTTSGYAAPVGFSLKDDLLDNFSTNKDYFLVLHENGTFNLAQNNGGGTWNPLIGTLVNYKANQRYRAAITIGLNTGASFAVYEDLNDDGDFDDNGENINLLTSLNSIATGTWDTAHMYMGVYSAVKTVTIYNAQVNGSPVVSLPSQVTGLSGVQGDNQVSLTWAAPNDNGSTITDYKVEYKLSSEPSTWIQFTDGISVNTTTTVTGLMNGNSYDFRISAINGGGSGPFSMVYSSIPISITPAAPIATGVAISGASIVGSVLTGTYSYSDVNGDLESGSTFRWLRSDTAGGIYTAIPNATNITYTLTIEDINKYVKFEVTPKNDFTPISGISVLSGATSQISNVSYLYHILSTGQSLSQGYNGSPALSIAQPFFNKMLSGTNFIPLAENSVETMSSSMANSLTNLSGILSRQFAVTRHGSSATAYSGLKKGTTPYSNGIAQAVNVKNAATLLGKVDRVIGVTTIHGESDHLAGTTQSTYEADLVEWQNDYNTDVKAITGQSQDIPLFTDQMSSQSGYNSTTSVIPLAQLSAAENNPTKIYLVGPKYFLTYSDTAHLVNTSYRWLGEYYSKVIQKVVFEGEAWKPLSPETITRNGNIIYAKFHVPEGQLAFDTTGVSARTNYGFEYYDSTASASISSVALEGTDTVKITLNTVPTGASQQLRYAYTSTPGAKPGAQVAGSAAGNLRDTDSAVGTYSGNHLYNWAVQFSKPIIEDSIIPNISSIANTSTNTTTTFTWTTDELSSSHVEYGVINSYGATTTEADIVTRVTSHSVTASNLLPCTVYHYRVVSKDSVSNTATSSDSTFSTTGCNGSASIIQNSTTPITYGMGGQASLTTGTADLEITIPANATPVNVFYQIKQLSGHSVISGIGSPTGVDPSLNHIYDLKALSGVSTEVSSFSQPISITLTYQDNEVAGLDESTLGIYHYSGGVWTPLSPCTVNATANTVTCPTTSFSVFALFGQPIQVSSNSTNSTSSSKVSGIRYGCKDKNATNYDYFSKHNQEFCKYEDIKLPAPTTTIVRNLKIGSNGPDVKNLQQYLNNNGYLLTNSGVGSKGNETNYFGQLTKNAVIKLQRDNKLVSDGIVGPITRAILLK